MNINLKKFSLTILAALTLTACGSGSGASASNAPTAQPSTLTAQPSTLTAQPSALAAQPSTPAAQPSTPATQPSEQAVLEMPKRSPTNTGLVFSIKIESEEDSVGQINTINNEQELSNRTLTSIDVDGKQIPIAFTENWNEAKYIEQPLNGVPHICCNKYTAMRFGAIASNEAGQNDILFYNGIPTEKLPDSGEVTYEGESIMTSKESVIPDDYMKGSSKFIVNFGDKKLSGSLIIDTTKSTSSSQKVKIDIEKAKITGNTFSGTAQSDSFKSQGIAEGKFYGDGAKELGGMVKAKDNSWAGAYGAKAQ
ncbi:TPA: Slam-dependent surface lipoprotein [Haemophilus influenzae]